MRSLYSISSILAVCSAVSSLSPRVPAPATTREAQRKYVDLREGAFRKKPFVTSVARSIAGASVEEQKERKGMALLRFVGSTTFTTASAPLPSAKLLDDFFAAKENKYILLRGTGNTVETIEEPAPSLWERWEKEAKFMNAAAPAMGDEIVQVTTAGISFPGLKVLSIATIGTKLVKNQPLPEYQFTLIKDETRAQGPKPLVWVFNKLSGADKEKSEQATHSLNRIWASKSGLDDVEFTSDATLEIGINFPSILLKILPVSKEKAEEQGSASIQKAVEKDVAPALNRFREEYVQWLKS